MSSRCPPGVSVVLAAALLLGACERARRDLENTSPQTSPQAQELTAAGQVYERSAYHVSEGSRLFRWYNCSGCHANGGGGMGPAFLDNEWRYGSSIEQIYATIRNGRPNGMPSFKGKATETQIWQLAAYVRSLGGMTPQASSSRREAMTSTPPRNQAEMEEIDRSTTVKQPQGTP